MNKSDSERLATALEKLNYSPALKKEGADLVVINACSVRQSAVNRIYGQIKNLKKQNKKTKIILTGCLLNRDKNQLKNEVDLIFDIKNLSNLSKIISGQFSEKNNDSINYEITVSKEADMSFLQTRRLVQRLKKTYPPPDYLFRNSKNYLKINPKRQSPSITYVPIMTGCENFCSYCVVPYVRGKEYCRPTNEIVNEVKKLLKNGYKEIILLGQNVNSYLYDKTNFPKLLKIIDNLKGDFWLSFLTSHPKDLSDELLDVISGGKNISPYLHLPIQSGDDHILDKMNRKYSVKHYKNLIAKARKKIPHLAVSTDIIVGFPGETEAQFQNTAKLMKEIKFDMAYIAKYSPRPQTAAARLKDNVTLKEKKERWQYLTNILRETALENNKKLLYKTVTILAENENFGQTNTFKDVKFRGDKKLIGKFVRIKIMEAKPWGLKGDVLNKSEIRNPKS